MSSDEFVTMVLEDANGNSASIVLPGPGGVIRVAVGEPGKQSAVWRIFAPEKTYGDVYVAVRDLIGEQKWSLHESGDWRFQWVSKEKAFERTNTDDRIIDQWQQPEEIGESGWTKGFTIWVRHQDLVSSDTAAAPASTVWVPAPPEGHLVAIHVVIARPDQAQVELHGLTPFDGFMLADRRVLLLVHSVEPIRDERNQYLESVLAAIVERAPEGVDLDALKNPRVVVHGSKDGDRIAWDLALKPADTQR